MFLLVIPVRHVLVVFVSVERVLLVETMVKLAVGMFVNAELWRLVLVRQHRFGSGELSWEVPGGVIDPGETPSETAARELREETGFVGEKAKVIGSCRPNPAILRNRCHFVLVEGARLTAETDFDPNEELETRLLPLPKAMSWAKAGRIEHALSIDALCYLWLERGAFDGD